MRVRLAKGKQNELILSAKKNLSWREFSRNLGINQQYLYRELKNEKILLSKELFNKLNKLVKEDYCKYLVEMLNDNWGRSKGGLNSSGSIIKLPKVKLDENLAEFIGAVLGDGHVSSYSLKGRSRWIGSYAIRIAGDLVKDKDYHINYLRPLCKKIFNLNAREILRKNGNERFLDISRKEIVNLFINMGIKPGNKIKNQSTIPIWIFKKKQYLASCLRGLIDTDGSIFRMSKKDPNLIRIGFTNHNKTLLEDTRRAFIVLGFNPSKIINNRQFYISRQSEITKYLKEIGFSNKKHKDKIMKFYSPVV